MMRPSSIIFIVLCVGVFLLYLNSTTHEPFIDSPNFNLGNYLSDYYLQVLVATIQEKDFNFTVPPAYQYDQPSNDPFLQHLPTFIPYSTLQPYHDILHQDSITYETLTKDETHYFVPGGTWRLKERQDEIMATTLKPLMHDILDRALVQGGFAQGVNSKSPVIHFRCADVPFIRHENYYLQRYTFFRDALNSIDLGGKSVVLLSYVKHNTDASTDHVACAKYTEGIQTYLESMEYNVTVQSKSMMEDFATMFYAPAVISTGSSFSFFAGFFGKGAYRSTTQGLDTYCGDCSDLILKGYNLPHSDVEDYHDVTRVIEKLRQ